jgi:WD40 repeat protein
MCKLWDMRAGQEVQSRDCGHPVEDVLILPSAAVMVTAAQNEIRFWSVLGGGGSACISCCINHQKTVTCLKYDGCQVAGGGSTSGRVLSGSLDRHLKVLDVNTFKVTHSCAYPDPILSLDISANASLIAGEHALLLMLRAALFLTLTSQWACQHPPCVCGRALLAPPLLMLPPLLPKQSDQARTSTSIAARLRQQQTTTTGSLTCTN